MIAVVDFDQNQAQISYYYFSTAMAMDVPEHSHGVMGRLGEGG
jgi:hypothetical protein